MLSMQLTKLSAQSRETAVMAERNRMARDIHDTLAQGLTGVIVQLEAAADATSRGLSDESGRHLARAQGLARESLTEARRSVLALRPQELENKELCKALDGLVHRMTDGTAVNAHFLTLGTPFKLPAEWEDNILRAVKEVLTNVLRHARAKDFDACIDFQPALIQLGLRDNGCGFDPDGKFDGFGLLGIDERVKSMGGSLMLKSEKGVGTHFSIALPVALSPVAPSPPALSPPGLR
jgi:signal transduction histidine kinase